jgi:Sel1 repeat
MGDPGEALLPACGPDELVLSQPAAAAVAALKPRLRVSAVFVRSGGVQHEVAVPVAESEESDSIALSATAEADDGEKIEPGCEHHAPDAESSQGATEPAFNAETLSLASPSPEFESGTLCLAAAEDDPPFDAPEESDFLPAPEDAANEARLPPVVEATPEREPEPISVKSPPPAAPIVYAPDRHIYLAMARGAALDEERRVRDGAAIRRNIGASVSVGLALPLLLGGMFALNNSRADLGPASAPAATQPAALAQEIAVAPSQAQAPPAPVKDYEHALQMLASDQAASALAPLLRAAESGYALAQYRLAKLYEHGEGVPSDLALARQWTERAASSGNVHAMHDLGVYLAEGDGAARDETAAFRWFQQAAEFGIPDSQFNLGVLYQQGRGVSANAAEALYWFLVASRQRDVNAFDRALEIAVQLPRTQVSQVQARARAFRPRSPDLAANEATDAPA